MDERLQQVFHLRPLQEETIAYRNNMKLYRTLMKQTCKAELQNLVNVEMNIADKEMKMPDPKTVPPDFSENEDLTPKIDALLEDVRTTAIGMDLL
ncbi:uncharacterized protein LOC126767710 isoform X1 [Bactrocera neohumeralis]|uniref:uncharacterized protein LOC120766721 isoform X1 n=1 Tax=Bactrocera tryoni TaxID=59916 RepID=UPI001A96757D|nr:uncharacterized protein LOC120766721 isoform X1 [Bactrocera tryoni]XP_050341212.1 uncharacterized protein LOC126767710 isoform X1 [Bactrocera neohumeralis]